eukprot:653660-Prymnesium_polylepis.1
MHGRLPSSLVSSSPSSRWCLSPAVRRHRTRLGSSERAARATCAPARVASLRRSRGGWGASPWPLSVG